MEIDTVTCRSLGRFGSWEWWGAPASACPCGEGNLLRCSAPPRQHRHRMVNFWLSPPERLCWPCPTPGYRPRALMKAAAALRNCHTNVMRRVYHVGGPPLFELSTNVHDDARSQRSDARRPAERTHHLVDDGARRRARRRNSPIVGAGSREAGAEPKASASPVEKNRSASHLTTSLA